MKDQLEIERRWLLFRAPDYSKAIANYDITQHYGTDGLGPFRIRCQVSTPKGAEYFLTRKTPISPGIAHEVEKQISKSEFELFGEKCKEWISKARFIFKNDDLNFEVDIFRRDVRLTIMEVELPSLEHPFEIPTFLQKCIIHEITGLESFSNHSIAKKSSL